MSREFIRSPTMRLMAPIVVLFLIWRSTAVMAFDLPAPLSLSDQPDISLDDSDLLSRFISLEDGKQSQINTDLPVDQDLALGEGHFTVHPGETLCATGIGLDDINLLVGIEGRLFQITPLRSEFDRLQAIIPLRTGEPAWLLPRATMFIWPVKGRTIGRPLRVNGAEAWWAWPCRISHGASQREIRIFGVNLTSDVGPSRLAIQGASQRAMTLWPQQPDAYELRAELPGGMPPGVYRVWAHNGSGGRWGWSSPVTIEVVEDPKGSAQIVEVDQFLDQLQAKGGEPRYADRAVAEAIRAVKANGGGAIRFGAREYLLQNPVVLPEHLPIVMRGAGRAKWDSKTSQVHNGDDSQFTVLRWARRTDKRPALVLNGPYSRLEDMVLVSPPAHRAPLIRLAAPDQELRKVTLVMTGTPMRSPCVESAFAGDANHTLSDCDIYLSNNGWTIRPDVRFVRAVGCRFYGMYSQGPGTDANAIEIYGRGGFIVEDCLFQSDSAENSRILNRSLLVYEDGASFGYYARNRSINVGPRSSVPGIDGNTGEQYLFHSRNSGTLPHPYGVREANDYAIRLTSKLGPIEARDGWVILIVAGRGIGQWRVVDAQIASDELRVAKPWIVIPDRQSRVLMTKAFRHHLLIDNVVDACPDRFESGLNTVGAAFWFKAFGNVIARNTFRNVGWGLYVGGRPGRPSGWNQISDNLLENVTDVWRDDRYPSAAINELIFDPELDRQQTMEDLVMIGNAYRRNRVVGAVVGARLGWLRFRADLPVMANLPRRDGGILLTVIETNRFEKVSSASVFMPPLSWPLWRDNTATRTAGANARLGVYHARWMEQPLFLEAPSQRHNPQGDTPGGYGN